MLSPHSSFSKRTSAVTHVLRRSVLAIVRHDPYDISNYQYPALVLLGILDFFMMASAPLVQRVTMYASLLLACLLPVTCHFFVPALPIFAWLFTFFGYKLLPSVNRSPYIFVSVLGSLERVLYGANLSSALSAHKHVVLDVLAWLPYGIIHFVAPFITSASLFWFAPPGSLPVFSHAFGYMNLAGVITQLLIPTAPPWYEAQHGTQPATYSMPGSPAGLARIDALFGVSMYADTFASSPLVFGAFPSLHSGTATIQALFWTWVAPRLAPLWGFYVLWVWWATMYLSHHYFLDLVGGSMYAVIAFFLARPWLPKISPASCNRWAYPDSPRSLWAIFTGERKSMHAHRDGHDRYYDHAWLTLSKDEEKGYIADEENELFDLDSTDLDSSDLDSTDLDSTDHDSINFESSGHDSKDLDCVCVKT